MKTMIGKAGLAAGILALASTSALTSTSALAKDPKDMSDGSWVTLNGVITSAGNDAFRLDYGTGTITVEMDDWDWYREGRQLIEGDKVTVYGAIDDNFYNTTSIEAERVYVKNLNRFFYASDVDEEEATYFFDTRPLAVSGISYTGRVSDIEGREFTLNTGARRIRVDTSDLGYNPMEERNLFTLANGDFVSVSGAIDDGLLKERELIAQTITTLHKDKTKRSGM